MRTRFPIGLAAITSPLAGCGFRHGGSGPSTWWIAGDLGTYPMLMVAAGILALGVWLALRRRPRR